MYVSLAVFVLILLVYYIIFRRNELDIYMILFFYFTIIMSQLIGNSTSIYYKCNTSDNLIDVVSITLIPWIFLFGVVYALLLFASPSISEGLKSPFANVIGYFIVSGEANEILNTLLVDSDVSTSIHMNSKQLTEEEKVSLEKTSQVILKIMGNMTILINEITPSNFETYWNNLVPLMKDSFKTSPDLNNHVIKTRLKQLVNRRDAVGEFGWLLYTGILCVALCGYQIDIMKCSKTATQLKLNFDDYIKEKQQTEKLMSNAYSTANSATQKIGT